MKEVAMANREVLPKEALSPVWPHYTDILVERAEGIYLYSGDGRRYIDFTCAAAVATIQALREEGLVENSARQGAFLLERLRELQARHPCIGDVRGLGLMVATEFSAADGAPDKPTAKAVLHACLERGLLLLTCGPYDNTIRWIPPLIVTREHLEEALRIFEESLQEVAP